MTIANCKLQIDRYIRQMRFPPLGEEGQRRLASARALVCGCGALGSVIANTLVRAGVGAVRIVDRDFVELSNLARQTLFDEADAAAGLPKAVAAAEKLRRINSSVEIVPVVADVNHTNIERFCDGVDVILDDRNDRPGVKFKDSELVGFPIRIGIGEKSLAKGEVELKPRAGAMIPVKPEEAVEKVLQLIKELTPAAQGR